VTGEQDKPPTPRHVAMNWARRLKRVFGIDIEGCAGCGGKLRIIASIEDVGDHLQRAAAAARFAGQPMRAVASGPT
jgi:pyruvate/2-oxoglutarate dehydrogenase complex dihydrolipoamide acyltransferase (E2) component